MAERIDRCRKTGNGISYLDHQKSPTEIRRDADFSRFHAQCQRSALIRLDKAFRRFFGRVKQGQQPGIPRFKGRHRRVRALDIPVPVIHGTNLHVKGIGKFRLRSVPDGEIRAARVVKTARRIELQLVVGVESTAKPPMAPLGLDLGNLPGPGVAGRRALKRKRRALARVERGSSSRHRKRTALAGWEIQPKADPGASEGVPVSHVAAMPGQDAGRDPSDVN